MTRASILEEVRNSSIMQSIWASYVEGSSYVGVLTLDEVVDSALKLAEIANLKEY